MSSVETESKKRERDPDTSINDNKQSKPTPPKGKKTTEKKGPNPETSGFWPNFKYMKFDRKYLMTGERFFPVENLIRTHQELFDALGIKNEKEKFSIGKANEAFARIEQRSKAWFLARSMDLVDVTGNDEYAKYIIGSSSLSALTGLWTKKAGRRFHGEDWKWGDNNQFRECVKKEEKNFDRVQRTRMEWGKQKEDDALISLIQNLPNYHFFTLGSLLVPGLPKEEIEEKKVEPKIIVLVSPDFACRDTITGILMSGELKCPAPLSVTQKEGRFHYWEKDVYIHTPIHYLGQMLTQIVAMYLESGCELGLFSCMTLNHGSRAWIYKINWDLWDMMIKVANWAVDRYVIGCERVPLDDEMSPFDECPFYDHYLDLLELYQKDYVKMKDYELKEEWVESGFEFKFFDDENGKDMRKKFTVEEQEKYKGCSAEAVPKIPKKGERKQSSLFDYM